MAKDINLTIENKLVMEKRDMNVYHHATRSAHMISFDSSVTVPLKPVIEDDYVHISIVSGPGPLESKCMVNLPSWVDFDFFPEGNVTVTHSSNRILLKIPPGPSTWQLKMRRSATALINKLSDCVIIGDAQVG